MVAFFQRFAAAAPWITLALLLAMFAFAHGRLALAPGVSIDLPSAAAADDFDPGASVALAMPARNAGDASGEGLLVFFDDARYRMSDPVSAAAFARRLEAKAETTGSGRLTLLADRRLSVGDLTGLLDLARRSGVRSVQIVERRD